MYKEYNMPFEQYHFNKLFHIKKLIYNKLAFDKHHHDYDYVNAFDKVHLTMYLFFFNI
jgi:hypothetical protein